MRSTAVSTPSSFVTFRRITVAGCLAGASVLALGSSAFAQTTTTPGSTTTATNSAKAGRPSPLTAAQQACLTSKGFGPKSKPAVGSAPATKTTKTEAERTAERIAREAAAKACGVTLPAGGRGGRGGGGGHGPGGKDGSALTADQQACLTTKGFPKSAAPAAGNTATKPAAPTADQRTAFEAAAKACGITVPLGGGHGGRGAGGHGDGAGRGQGGGKSANKTTATTIKA